MALTFLILFKFLFLFPTGNQGDVPRSIYDFKVASLKGDGTIDLSAYKGKKILIVNTPIVADFKPQYAQLEALYQKYKDKMVIIAFPDDDFGPPPGGWKGYEKLEKHYNVTFPMAAKVITRGDNMSPIYQWLTQMKFNKHGDTEIAWDFQKFLINENGELVAEFNPNILATNPELIAAIEKQ